VAQRWPSWVCPVVLVGERTRWRGRNEVHGMTVAELRNAVGAGLGTD
jgi:hypothetical protein